VTGIDRRQDRLWTAGVGFIALATYVRTLAPGLTSDPDSAMFQFIGRVLGVAHNPGYPLYVLLTHAFSYLPIGSLAYRINLFSALCGAIAVSLMFLASRRLGCGRLVSAGAALGFAFACVLVAGGLAEVYAERVDRGRNDGAPSPERDAQTPVVLHGGRAICRARSSNYHRRLSPRAWRCSCCSWIDNSCCVCER
jgi:hypothetical protein